MTKRKGFVLAIFSHQKAKAIGATVVTAEKFKPNSAQLPNLCKELGVKYISYDDFMALVDE